MTATLTVGVDFGYSFVRIAVFRDGIEGQASTVDNIENDLQSFKTPAVIAFDGGTQFVGEEAINHATIKPKCAVFGLKRLIGCTHDVLDKRNLRNCHFDYENRDGELSVRVPISGDTTDSFTVEELLAFIFSKIKEYAEYEECEEYDEVSFEKMVISVPSCFSKRQRQALVAAATIEGIEVKDLIPDTAAVAYYYVWQRMCVQNNGDCKLFIFSFGASTLQVALIDICDYKLNVLSTSGSLCLGGVDFDDRLIGLCVKKFQEVYNYDATEDMSFMHKLRIECEKAKRKFRSKNNICVKVNNGDINLRAEITNEEFEEVCENLFGSIKTHVEKIFRNVNCVQEEVDEVVVIGDSSRLKRVEAFLGEFFNGKKISTLIGDEVVKGAAIYASKLSGVNDENVNRIEMTSTSTFFSEDDGILGAKLEFSEQLMALARQVYVENEMKFAEIRSHIQYLFQWIPQNPEPTEEELTEKLRTVNELADTFDRRMSKEAAEEENTFVGMDVGTCNCRLSIIKDGVCEVIALEENEPLPSNIAFVDEDFVYGTLAKNNFISDPQSTFYSIKRLMGRIKDEALLNELRYLTYPVDQSSDALKVLILTPSQSINKAISAVEMTALLILKMKLAAEEYLRKNITSVTISVPTTSCYSQRQSIHDAALIAGFKTVKLVNDTVAISMKHLWDKRNEERVDKKSLVFSMGAGFTSISIIEIKKNCIDVMAHNGLNFGGNDFDNRLYEVVIQNPLTNMKSENMKPRNLSLRAMCESAKILLSKEEEAYIDWGETRSKIKRSDLSQIWETEFSKICGAINQVLNESNIEVVEINEVLLSGGSTKLPVIKELFSKNFPNAEILEFDDNAVAVGCSVYSAVTSNFRNEERIELRDRCSSYYSFEANKEPSVILERQSKIPITVEGVIASGCDNQTTFHTNLFESSFGSDKKIFLSSKTLRPFLKCSKGSVCFNVKMTVDENGLLKLNVCEKYSRMQIPYSLYQHLSAEEMKRMAINTETRMQKNKTIVDRKRKLKDLVKAHETLLIDIRQFLEDEAREKIDESLTSANDVIRRQECTADECDAKINEIESYFRKLF